MANGRCDMHGGKSTGAKSPHRPIKHGLYTKESIREWLKIREILP
jgi:hypothetical protein